VGQKEYLAERFKFFEGEFHACQHARLDEGARAAKRLGQLEEQLAQLDAERAGLHARLQRDVSTVELQRTSDLSALKDAHAAELRRMHEELEAERRNAASKLEATVKEADTTQRKLHDELDTAQQRLRRLESEKNNLVRQGENDASAIASLQSTVERLERMNKELETFKLHAEADRVERTLREATTGERLKHFERVHEDRTTELAALRKQHETQSQYATHLKDQLDAANNKVSVLESNLQRARTVFQGQQQQIATLKEKLDSFATQVHRLEELVTEKTRAADRAKQELELAGERLEMANAKAAELRDQLKDVEDTKAKQATQLKQNEDALMHMQRLSSAGGARAWASPRLGVDPGLQAVGSAALIGRYGGAQAMPSAVPSRPSTAGGAPLSSAPPTAGLFRDFARGASAAPTIASFQPQSYDTTGLAAHVGASRPADMSHTGLFARTGAVNTSTGSAATFEPVVKPDIGASSRTDRVPTSAYFPSLE
jgi:chromosome segregation ATPase